MIDQEQVELYLTGLISAEEAKAARQDKLKVRYQVAVTLCGGAVFGVTLPWLFGGINTASAIVACCLIVLFLALFPFRDVADTRAGVARAEQTKLEDKLRAYRMGTSVTIPVGSRFLHAYKGMSYAAKAYADKAG